MFVGSVSVRPGASACIVGAAGPAVATGPRAVGAAHRRRPHLARVERPLVAEQRQRRLRRAPARVGRAVLELRHRRRLAVGLRSGCQWRSRRRPRRERLGTSSRTAVAAARGSRLAPRRANGSGRGSRAANGSGRGRRERLRPRLAHGERLRPRPERRLARRRHRHPRRRAEPVERRVDRARHRAEAPRMPVVVEPRDVAARQRLRLARQPLDRPDRLEPHRARSR